MFVQFKHNKRQAVNIQWVFRGLDTKIRDGFLVAVNAMDADTLLAIFWGMYYPRWPSFQTCGYDQQLGLSESDCGLYN